MGKWNSVSSQQENTFLQWTFKLNGAPAGTQCWNS